ncbi:hypothetical protein D3C78_1176020 [compost metagenome]
MNFFFKTIALMLLLVVSVKCVQAQTGSVMLYGSLNYKSSKDVSSEFKANPIGVGYQFNNNVVAGLNFAFDVAKDGNKNTISTNYEAGPFYSYGVKLGEHFVIIGQVDAHYQWGSGSLDGKLTQPVNYNGYLLRVYPIAGILLGKGWALKAKWGELSYSSLKGKDAAHTMAQDFTAGANGNTIGIGVSKNLMFKKKKA